MTRYHRPGDRLGVFRLVELLGQGGQGNVYRAFDTERGECVALKILHGSEEELDRIRREFRALEGIRHPNIVPFYELGQHADTTYYTMQIVEGSALLETPVTETVTLNASSDDRIVSRPVISTTPPDPARWLAGLVAAVERIHLAGLLHLDIKPSNLLLDGDGKLLLVDFGLTTRFDIRTSQAISPAQVSIGYSSPEHRNQDRVSPASDWFGVGATLFCALFGHPPGDDIRVEARRAAGAGSLGSLCAALLSPDPAQRAGPSAIRLALGEQPNSFDLYSRNEPEQPPTERTEFARLREIEVRDSQHRIGIFKIDETIEDLPVAVAAGSADSVALELRARCRQWESVPFGVLSDLVLDSPLRPRVNGDDTPSLSRMLFGMADDGAPDPSEAQNYRRRAARELNDLLGSSDDGTRPTIRIDAFQWCDLDSLALLLDLLTLPNGHRTNLVLTYRETGATAPAVERLNRWLLSEPPEVVHRDFDPDLSARTQHAPQPLPPLSPAEAAYLDLCATAGTRISQHEIRLALPDPASELNTLWSLRSMGLVTSSGARLRDHVETSSSVTERVNHTLSPSRGHALHLRLARSARLSPYGTPASIGHHYSLAGLPALAHRHLLASGRAARDAYAFDRAAEFFTTALSTPSLPESERSELLGEAAFVLKQCGRGREAADAWLEAAQESSGERARGWRLAAAEMLLTSGHYSEGRALLRRLAADFGVRFPKTQLEAMRRAGTNLLREYLLIERRRSASPHSALALSRSKYCNAAFQGLMPVDPMRAAVFATEGVRWSRKSGDDLTFAGSIVSLASGVLSPSGHRMRAWGSRMLETSSRLATRSGNDALLARVEIARSTMAFWEGEWKSALDLTDSARRLLGSTRVERAFDRNVLNLVRTRALEEIGLWDRGHAETAEMYADAVERNDAYASVTARLNLGMLALAKGDIAAARRWADRAVEEWPGKGMQVQHLYALRVHAYADLCDNRSEVAWDRLHSNWEAIQEAFHLRVTAGRVDVFVLRGRIAASRLHATDDSAKWKGEVEHAIKTLMRIQRSDARAHAAMLRACALAYTHGLDADHSIRAIREASSLYRSAHMNVLAMACDCFTHTDPNQRSRTKALLERTGIADADQWIRGFVPLQI